MNHTSHRLRWTQSRLASQAGSIELITALLLVALLVAAAFVVDLGRTRHYRQQLQDATDLASVAAAGLLPAQGTSQSDKVLAIARKIAIANAPQLASAGLDIGFRCIVSDPGTGGANSPDLRYACGPAEGRAWEQSWTTTRGRATHACDPSAGDLCNAIVVRASQAVKYFFAPVIGINDGSTGTVQALACKGFCGQTGGPLDVALVLDRTASMSAADIANVKNAADTILTLYDPTQQNIALFALPHGTATDKCTVASPQNYPDSVVADWLAVGFSHDYQLPNGDLNPSSQLVAGINCLERTGNPTVTVNGHDVSGAGHTDLGDPMAAAADYLLTDGRVGVPKIVIFMTDGEANQPYGLQPCSYAVDKANQAKAAGIDIFTIGYGVAHSRCREDTASSYASAYGSTSLAAMATNSVDHQPGGCAPTENTDGDNYFCEARSADLTDVFRRVAIATIKHARLLDAG